MAWRSFMLPMRLPLLSLVLQACFLGLSMKRAHNQKDDFFKEQCAVQARVLLPAGNSMNITYAMMRKLLDCQEVQDIEEHVCVNGCCKFKHLQPPEYASNKTDSCPKCHELRFTTKVTARK